MRKRVLIVDDDREAANDLARALMAREIDAVAAGSAEEALTRLDEEPFALVVTDLELYGPRSGVDLCHEIAQRRGDILVVVMTAYPSMDSVIRAIRAGAYDYVAKPVDVMELTITTEAALRHAGLREEVK